MADYFEHENLIKFTFLQKVPQITKDIRTDVKEERVLISNVETLIP
jgi:5-bromo-4-chloroindolyl phosphate hydrolysis protein